MKIKNFKIGDRVQRNLKIPRSEMIVLRAKGFWTGTVVLVRDAVNNKGISKKACEVKFDDEDGTTYPYLFSELDPL